MGARAKKEQLFINPFFVVVLKESMENGLKVLLTHVSLTHMISKHTHVL